MELCVAHANRSSLVVIDLARSRRRSARWTTPGIFRLLRPDTFQQSRLVKPGSSSFAVCNVGSKQAADGSRAIHDVDALRRRGQTFDCGAVSVLIPWPGDKMKSTVRHVLITATTLTIYCFSTSISASGPNANRPELVARDDQALVVFCRASALKGVAWGHDYYIDGVHVAKLSSGGYTQVNIPAREVMVSTGPKRNPTFRKRKIDAKVGRIYYVIDDPGNSFASYETLSATGTDDCTRRAKKFQAPIANSIE